MDLRKLERGVWIGVSVPAIGCGGVIICVFLCRFLVGGGREDDAVFAEVGEEGWVERYNAGFED